MKGSQGEEVVADVMDGALFHLSFFMGASDIAGMRDDGKRPEERQKGLIEPDERPIPFDHRGEHIIGNQFSRGPLKEAKRIDEAPVKCLLPLRVGELQVE